MEYPIDLVMFTLNYRYNTDFTEYFYTVLSDGASTELRKPTGWFLITMVLRGPDDEVVIYHDATQVAQTTEKKVIPDINSLPGLRRVFIGRKRVSHDQDYASIMVDELTMWNRKLTQEEVTQIYEMYQN